MANDRTCLRANGSGKAVGHSGTLFQLEIGAIGNSSVIME